MYEVEVKLRADHELVREGLASANATFVGTVTQIDTYYDAPHRDFARTDEALRIRRAIDDASESLALTYKGPLIDSASKSRTEIETTVGNGERMGEILDALGFEAAATVEKRRERYAIDGCSLQLDTVEGLGEFVEIEAKDHVEDLEDLEAAREKVISVLESLGLDPDEQIRTSYLGLLLEE